MHLNNSKSEGKDIILARIEVSKNDIPVLAAPENAQRIHTALTQLGFAFITLDLAGYRTGSMNEVLGQ